MTKSIADRVCPWETPWGRAVHRQEIAPGIWEVSTPSHGGIWLSADRVAELKERFPCFTPWAGYPWLEEDCDWALAAICWPGAFSRENIWHAVRIVKSQHARKPEYFGIGDTFPPCFDLACGCIANYQPE